QITFALVRREQLAKLTRELAMLLRRDRVHHARERAQDVDGGPASARAELTVEDHVAVEDAAHFVRDRLLHVAAFDKHRVERGDAAALVRAASLEQSGQRGEDARWVAAARGWLSGGEPHL